MEGEVTIDDIAKVAKVSRATVSRVINGNPLVKSKTAEYVQQIMEELGYAPSAKRPGPKPRNAHPSRLRNGVISLITIGGTGELLQEPIMSSVVQEIQSACQKRKLSLLLDQMTSADEIPYCVQTHQIDAAIVMIAGRPLYHREAITNLARQIPCIHLFAPGHPVPTVDHATVNDVAIGALAFKTLKEQGCRSFSLVNASDFMHEALFVRGRAFLDRIQYEDFPAITFASPMKQGSPERVWPGPLKIYKHPSEIAAGLKQITEQAKGPIGLFSTLEQNARELHAALEKEALLSSGKVKLVIAGTTHFFVRGLNPAPILIDLNFPKLINIVLERLIHRTLHHPTVPFSLMILPSLIQEPIEID
jgi:DNA-binding LacI/PurR family transcriptional regulator